MAAPGLPAFPTVEPRVGGWPALPVARWQDTRDTLHLWTQVVGKLRLALAPAVDHWWQVPLYVNVRELTPSLMPHAGGLGVEVVLDLTNHQLLVQTTNGAVRRMVLEPRSVADFHGELTPHLRDLGVDAPLHGTPVEVTEAVPLAEDHEHASYDADAVHRFWTSLVSAHRVLSPFRGRFRGKASPVHLSWGAFDLATTRFSGRAAAPHSGGVPNCPDWGDDRGLQRGGLQLRVLAGGHRGRLLRLLLPRAPGYRQHAIVPATVAYHDALDEIVLPYADVRAAAADPPRTCCFTVGLTGLEPATS